MIIKGDLIVIYEHRILRYDYYFFFSKLPKNIRKCQRPKLQALLADYVECVLFWDDGRNIIDIILNFVVIITRYSNICSNFAKTKQKKDDLL